MSKTRWGNRWVWIGVGILLSLLVLTGYVAREVSYTLSARAAAFRVWLADGDGQITADKPVCVRLLDIFGWEGVPPGYVDDVMARNPGLRSASECRFDREGTFVDGREEPVPLVSCGKAYFSRSSRPPESIGIDCWMDCGPLCGQGKGFNVTVNSDGEFVAQPSGEEWLE